LANNQGGFCPFGKTYVRNRFAVFSSCNHCCGLVAGMILFIEYFLKIVIGLIGFGLLAKLISYPILFGWGLL